MTKESAAAQDAAKTANPASIEPTTKELIDGLRNANEELKRLPSFDKASEICLETRVVWGYYYSDWLETGGDLPVRSDDVGRLFEDCGQTVLVSANHVKSAKEQDYLKRYSESIALRKNLLDLLTSRGADAVEKAVRREMEKRSKAAKSVASSTI